MATSLTYLNAALTRMGDLPITGLDDGTAAAIVATENYEVLVTGILSGYPWKWATKTAVLNQLAVTVDLPWTFAYQIPTDLLELRTVEQAGLQFPYEIKSDKLLCDVDNDTDLVASYVWRATEDTWPAWFGELITQRLEALFLRALAFKYQEAEAREKSAEDQASLAKLQDSRLRTPRDPTRSPTLAARGSTTTSLLAARGTIF